MSKKTNSISINILSVLVILVCLLLTIITPTNSWFTNTTNDGVIISVDIGDLKLKLYQNNVSDANEIYSNDVNNKFMTDGDSSTNPQYLVLNDEVIPGEPTNLNLILANKGWGSTSMYIKFKFEVYVRGIYDDTKLDDVALIGFDSPDEDSLGFVLEEDGYYYYQNNLGDNALFEKGQEVTLMQKFQISLNSFASDNGNMMYTNCESIYFKLDIDASVNENFI